MTGYHTRWVHPPEQAEDPERVAVREALAERTEPMRHALEAPT